MPHDTRRPKAWLSWSGGKDAAWALHVLRTCGQVEVTGLLSTVDETTGVMPVHGVPRHALEAQAAALGLPLHVVGLPWPCPDATYATRLAPGWAAARALGVTHVAFGDLFLEDIRAFREGLLAPAGLAPLFPLWGADTAALAEAMLDAGLDAVVVAVDTRALPSTLVGRRWDRALLAGLPPGTDPCGERGECHTFVRWAPGFAAPVAAP